MQNFRVADVLVQPCLIDTYNVRVFGVHKVLEAMEFTNGLPDCWGVSKTRGGAGAGVGVVVGVSFLKMVF